MSRVRSPLVKLGGLGINVSNILNQAYSHAFPKKEIQLEAYDKDGNNVTLTTSTPDDNVEQAPVEEVKEDG